MTCFDRSGEQRERVAARARRAGLRHHLRPQLPDHLLGLRDVLVGLRDVVAVERLIAARSWSL